MRIVAEVRHQRRRIRTGLIVVIDLCVYLWQREGEEHSKQHALSFRTHMCCRRSKFLFIFAVFVPSCWTTKATSERCGQGTCGSRVWASYWHLWGTQQVFTFTQATHTFDTFDIFASLKEKGVRCSNHDPYIVTNYSYFFLQWVNKTIFF